MDLVPSLRSAYKRLQGVARCEAVYVTGPPSSGKTTLVRKLFEDKHKEYLHAYIDCYSIKNQAQLLSKVCQAFHSTMNVRRSRASKSVQRLPEPGAPVSLNDFYEAILEYRKLAYDKGYKRIFIVLDQVEEFDYTTLIETLVALVRYNMLDIRLIMISCEHPSDAFHAVTRKSPSIGFSLQDRCQVVCCSAWTVDDITSWILQAPPKQRVDLYRKFVANVVTLVFTTETKDPMMIRMYCQEHFEDFIIYYKKRRRETVLKKLALDPNSSEITDKELDDCEKQGVFDANLLVGNFLQTFKLLVHKSKDDNSKWKSSDTATRLTKNSAVLIVAAYIAAYTKPSDDKWNFIRYQRRKTSSRGKTDNHHDHHNRVFPLERLVQIYFELMKKATGDETLNFIENNDGVLADIERFKNLNILQHHSGFQFCSEARYKLSGIIKPDYVAKIAENNGLELSMFQGLPESFSTTK